MKQTIAIGVFMLLAFACVFHALYFQPFLPDQVPSNFNTDGEAHGWTPKNDFVAVYVGMVGVVAIFFPGLAWATRKMPLKWINLPDKAYWMADERREETLNYIFVSMTWMGTATLFFTLVMFDHCFQAGLGTEGPAGPPLPSAGITGVLYTIYLLGHIYLIYRRFKRT